MAELLALSDQTDENGRLLLEDSAPRKARKRAEKAGVAMRTTRCTYADSPLRLGGLMNASAYDALRHDTAEMLNGFAWLAGGYLAIHPAHKGTTRGLFDVANMGVTLPLVLFHRAEGAIAHHGQLPSWVGSLFKASRGVFSATVDLGNRSGPGAALTAAETVAFAEEAGHLRRPETARVCAAPTRLIERTIAVMLTGEGADPSRSHLGQWLDFALLWRFYSVQEAFSDALSEYRFVLSRLAGETGVTDPEALAGAPVTFRGVAGTLGQLNDAMVARANDVQDRLNAVLGRGQGGAPISFRELIRLL